MKYSIKIKSNKNPALADSSEFYEKTVLINTDNYCDAVGIAMEEVSADKIDSKFLPLNITISKMK